MTLLVSARSSGLRVWAEDGLLVVRGPRRAEPLARQILERRPEILALLSTERPWPPRPAELAGWPVEWRQCWGERANELEASGLPWQAAERQAFDETRAAKEHTADV
jgi:hypothetical protein